MGTLGVGEKEKGSCLCPRAAAVAIGGTNVVACGAMWQNLPLPTGILRLFLLLTGLLLPVPEHWAEPLPPSWERQGRQRLTAASNRLPLFQQVMVLSHSHPL